MPEHTARDQTIEILIKASTIEEARKLATEIAGYTLGCTITEHGTGHFVVSDVFSTSELSNEFYSKIKSSERLAILRDSSQEAKRSEVLRQTEAVEGCLRKLLLRANGFIEDYYNLFLRPYTEKHAKQQTATMAGGLDPITCLLTFEGMLLILETDISWAKRTSFSPQDMLSLLNDAETVQELRQNLADKLKLRFVWDAIAESVLIKQYTWNQIAGDLRSLKELRNKAAHFQILTDKDVNYAGKRSKNLLAKIGQQNQKPQASTTVIDLPDIATWLNEQMLPVQEALANFYTAHAPNMNTMATVVATVLANQIRYSQLIESSLKVVSDKIIADFNNAGILQTLLNPSEHQDAANNK